MSRRNLLKGFLGLGAVSLAGRAVLEERPKGVTSYVPVPEVFHRETGRSYHDMYWEAQAHIDALEAELNKPSLSDKLKAAGFQPIGKHGDYIA